MEKMISKSKFKPRALHYFREVEKTGRELIICDRGKPVLKIVPYAEDPEEALKALRNTVINYTDPTEPVGLEDWEALKRSGKMERTTHWTSG
jgi:prevent-host-death family protein